MKLQRSAKLGSLLFAPLAIAFALAPALLANDTAAPTPNPSPVATTPAIPAPAAVPATAPTPAPSAAPSAVPSMADPVAASANAEGVAANSAPPLGLFTPEWVSPRSLVRDEAGGQSSGATLRPWEYSDGDYPRLEWFFGYSFWRATPETTRNRMLYLNGGSTSAAINVTRHVGLVFDVAGFEDDRVRVPLSGIGTTTEIHTSGNAWTFMAGPRFSFREGQWTPFGQVLFGAVLASHETIAGCSTGGSLCTPLPAEKTYAATAGGGLDIGLSPHVALRLFQLEYLLTGFRNPSTPSFLKSWQSNIRFSTGIVFRSGGNPPPPAMNHAPVAACSADKSMVFTQSGDFVTVSANASDADNDPLTYTWGANGGAVEGSGAQVRWNSGGVGAGTYTVRVSVSDGRGGTAACSADIQVAPRPDHPPTMTCSADRTTVTIGDLAQITATANSPDNDPLTYSWTVSGGRIRGAAEAVQFDTGGIPAGSYTVSGTVDDGNGGTANCALGIDVQAPPPPPEMVALEARLSLHSIYFATARPTAANPTGGLLDSQQKTLLALAADFQRYLTFRPDAHLILGGHADPRGSEAYNKALTARRVARTKAFLVEHLVPEADIDTQSFGKDDELTADQVRAQMADDPDLSPADKKEMMDNMSILVLANNRRVDVSLSTTGQQSTHRYPFNTADFLALISPAGGTHLKPAAPAPRKAAQP
jgi:outer membrane protein OmpA-like peptidoglycan-associated protein